MNRVCWYSLLLIIVVFPTFVTAEVYKANPHTAYHFDYPPYHDQSNIYTSVSEFPILVTSGQIIYDTNLDANDNGVLSMNPIAFQVNGSQSSPGPYPYTTVSFDHVKFTISSSGPVAVNNGLTTLTMSLYSGVYSIATFYSGSSSARTYGSVDFSVTPVNFSIHAFVANDDTDWVGVIQDNNNNDFFRTDPYNGLPGVTGSSSIDTNGAGIKLFGIQGSLAMTMHDVDFPGQADHTYLQTTVNPFNLRTYAVVPEVSSLLMTSTMIASFACFIGLARRLRPVRG